jgi:hypothetical protein
LRVSKAGNMWHHKHISNYNTAEFALSTETQGCVL